MSASQSELSESSRSRSNTVCGLCRQRKTKCDRKLPKCSFCVKAKVPCHYLASPQKRGLRAGYVTELESRIESLEQQVSALQDQAVVSQNVPDHQSSFDQTPALTVPATPSPNAVPRDYASSYYVTPTSDVESDLMSFPLSYYYTLVDLWFKEDHQWAPILRQDEIHNSLQALSEPVSHIPNIVVRAIIALKIAYSSQAISLGYTGRRRLSLHLRAQTLTEAMTKPCLQSIQAMFIIAILDAGSDDIPSTFNIMSMCRRSGEHIGIFRELLRRIEGESPAQVGPTSVEGNNANRSAATTWAILAFDAVTSLGVSWRDVSADLVDHLSGIAYSSTPDFTSSFRTHSHLCAIGLQPCHDFHYAYARGDHQTLQGVTLQKTEEIYQNLMSYCHGLPTTGYSLLADGAVDFDINRIFTRLLSHAASMMIYQRYVFDDVGDTVLARERCLESYVQVLDVVRNISDADAEINSPTFAHFLAVAARYQVIFCQRTGQSRGKEFDILMHGISMCARRWPLARRIMFNMRALLRTLDDNITMNLPGNVFDLKKSGLDISEELKVWMAQQTTTILLADLHGPYA